MEKTDQEISLIAVTGGPCSGKTSLLSIAPQKLDDSGRDAYVCKETATFLIEQGMRLKKAVHEKDWSRVQEYQLEILRAQFENESRMIRCAEREGRPAVILCDRGLPDSRAYLPEGREGDDIYAALLDEATGLKPGKALDRYKAVIKLTTAANGAESFYTLENNAARDETPEAARSLDARIEDAYSSHSHFCAIDNSTDFEAKKARALREIYRALGIPTPLEIERKYRLRSIPCLQHIPVAHRSVIIDQVYLHSEKQGEEIRVRRRTHGAGDSTYFMTHKKELSPGVMVETEKMIDWRKYLELLDRRDAACGAIEKERTCFLWKNQYFELDVFRNLPVPLCVLEIELTDLQQEVILPPFLNVGPADEVTDDPRFKTHTLAKALGDWQKKKSASNPYPSFMI